MTNLRDILNDLIIDTEERMKSYADNEAYPKFTEDEKTDLLDEYIERIKERLIG